MDNKPLDNKSLNNKSFDVADGQRASRSKTHRRSMVSVTAQKNKASEPKTSDKSSNKINSLDLFINGSGDKDGDTSIDNN